MGFVAVENVMVGKLVKFVDRTFLEQSVCMDCETVFVGSFVALGEFEGKFEKLGWKWSKFLK